VAPKRTRQRREPAGAPSPGRAKGTGAPRRSTPPKGVGATGRARAPKTPAVSPPPQRKGLACGLAIAFWSVPPGQLVRRLLGLALVVALVCVFLLSLARTTTSVSGGQLLPRPGRAVAPDQSCHPDASGIPAPGPCGDTWRYTEGANQTGSVMAPPSASVAAIAQALRSVGSPLADDAPRRDGRTYAEYLWDEGKRTGVDPGVVMGFFNAESNYGIKGIATQTHDLANERPVPGRPTRCSNDGCYVYDDTWFDGIDRIYGLLADYARRGLDTAGKVIPTWAPSSDYNDDAVYSRNVRATMQALTAAS